VVEHRLAKARVASSNLVSRSRSRLGARRVWSDLGGPQKDVPSKARYPSGKGEVCKTFMRRFDPGPRLQLSSHKIDLYSCSALVSPFVPNRAHAPSLIHLSSPGLLLGMDADPAETNLFGVLAKNLDLAHDGIALRKFGTCCRHSTILR
jgi:hypothetical protein